MLKKVLGAVFLFILPLVFSTGFASQSTSSHHYYNSIVQQAELLFVAAKASDLTAQALFPTVEQMASNFNNTEEAMFGFNWHNNIP